MPLRKKLSIIGKGKGWEQAPQGVESWGATQLVLRRDVDRVVDMNDYSNNKWGESESNEARLSIARAKVLGIPYIDLQNYPIYAVIEFFNTDYFSNTIDYMLALAIYEEYNDIGLFGVNMAKDGEYYYEKPGVDYWCGQAMGRGVGVKVHGGFSTIMKTPDGKLYGYGKFQVMR